MDFDKAIPIWPDLLPRKCDVIWHYKHLRKSGIQTSLAFHETTNTIKEIWTREDCPPMHYTSIRNNVERLWKDFQQMRDLQPEDGKKHRRLTPLPASVPTRRSGFSKSSDIPEKVLSSTNLEKNRGTFD